MPLSPPDATRNGHPEASPETHRPDREPLDASTRLLRLLRRSLEHAVTALGRKWDGHSFSTRRVESRDDAPSPRTAAEHPVRLGRHRRWESGPTHFHQVDGPGRLSLLVRFSVARAPEEDPRRVRVGVEDGPTVHYTIRPETSETAALSRKVTAFLLRELERHFGALSPTSSSASSPKKAKLALNREGEIRHLTPRARALLDYEDPGSVDPNFFSHVDGHNLRRVMRDLAEMVSGEKQSARWLLRLQTAGGRWRWFRAAVQNKLRARGAIELTLRPLSSAGRAQ